MASKQHQVETNVGVALINGAITAITKGSDKLELLDKIIRSAESGKHVIKRDDWTTKLSFKTFTKLKQEGILV